MSDWNAQTASSLEPGTVARRWLIALSSGVLGVYCLFFLCFAQRVGPPDHDQFLVFHELQYWNAGLFGLAKQWTPLMCSGLSLAGEPQVPFMSLSMALGYLIGPFWGLKLATVAYFIAGWTGAFLYAGLWMKERLQRVLAASLFIGNGFFICRIAYGHIDFVPFLVLPLMLWMLHQSMRWRQQALGALRCIRLLAAVLLMGGALSLAIDGSPVAIIHLLFWIGLYALVLAITMRSWTPIALLACALAITSLLDAGYLWPMIEAQTRFPRHTQNSFTSALSLLWFALLPVRGKLLPANGNGHELSVFIGPIIALAMWRYRHWLRENLPASMRQPLLVVTIASIVLGMGSLEPLHVPRWLSPFDLLRPLPGFRSIGVTGRYWGFLALPLSLLGAAALWRFVAEPRSPRQLALWMGAVLVLQLGFQTETILAQWVGTDYYREVPWRGRFLSGAETINYVSLRNGGLQGQFITPTRGVSDCYDNDDFIRADVYVGSQLIRDTYANGKWSNAAVQATAAFATWNQIELRVKPKRENDRRTATIPGSSHIQLILNQAYHPDWQLPGCQTLRNGHGNLIVDCPASRLREGPLTLKFLDQLSEHAASVSLASWRSLLGVLGALACAWITIWSRSRADARVRTTPFEVQ